MTDYKETYAACPSLECSNGCPCSLLGSSVFHKDFHVWMTWRHRHVHILALFSSLRQIQSPFLPSDTPRDPSTRPCCATPLPAFLPSQSYDGVSASQHPHLPAHKDQMGHMFSCEPSVWSEKARKVIVVYRQVPLSAKSSLSK